MDQAGERAATLPALAVEQVFPGAGEMARLMRAVDWSQTPLGPLDRWPQSLRTAVSICLTSRFPILIWWGPELVMLYNDAYRPILGAKHPASLGAAGRDVWPEIWDIIGPMLEGVLREGEATWSDDQMLPLERSGYPEECYFTFSYSPIHDESGGVGGVFCAVTETTPRVLAERRARAARDLAAAILDAHTAEDVCAQAADVLETMGNDIPFALLYLLDRAGGRARLAARAGIPGNHPLALPLVALEASSEAPGKNTANGAPWPLARVVQSGQREVVSDGGTWWQGAAPRAGRELTPHTALILPIVEPGQTAPSAVLVAAVSPMRALDDAYQGFYELLVSHLSAGLASAHAYEEERKRAEALAEIDRAKTTFFSNVSHEFRTPLTLILGPLEEALASANGDVPAPVREEVAVAHRNGLRLLKLVNTLLDFARIEAGRAQAIYAPADLAALTADLASAFRSLIERAGLRLVVDCPPLLDRALGPVYVDRDMWEKIVLNLLSNAFKFTFAGEIAVTLRAVDGRAVLAVRDTGTGIPPDELPRLFERFHRVRGARSRTHEGSGIGLALVQELVHLHGGTITVESAAGVGTTFTVAIPFGAAHLPAEHIQSRSTPAATSTALGAAPFIEEARRWLPDAPRDAAGVTDATGVTADAIPIPAAPSPPPAPGSGATRPHVLLADDNADMREYLRRLLGARYTVEAVGDGAAALAAARRHPPDLVLADVMMPELDGFALLRALRAGAGTRAIPIILLSARAGDEATVEGLEAGADDYLVKPFSAREVLARVGAHLEMARLRREAVARAQELETTFDAISDAVFIYDRDGRIERMNTAARILFGLDALPDYAGRSPEQRAALISARDEQGRPLPAESPGLARLLRGEALTGANALDVRLRLADGHELDVNIIGAPLFDETGAISGAVAISRDVTERRRLERRTREALEAFIAITRTMVEAPDEAGDAYDAHDAHDVGGGDSHGDFPVAEPSSGRSGGRHQESPLAQRLTEMTRGLLGCGRVAVTAAEEVDGRLCDWPVAIVGMTPEQERHWWVEQLAARPREVGAGLLPEDRQRLLAGEVLTLDLTRPPYQTANAYGITSLLWTAMITQGRIVGFLALDFEDPGGQPHVFTPEEIQIAEAAARLGAVVIERERLLREREEARARELAAVEATRRMDEFLGIASHELRTPLTSVTANVQLAERRLRALSSAAAHGEGGEEALEGRNADARRAHILLERSARQLTRLDRLVGDLLDSSRIQAGKLEMRAEPCDLAAIVREAVQEQRTAWPERSITLDLPRRSPVSLHADADRIGQVITNYLTNALKYSTEDAPVEVRLRVYGATARVEVRDHGPGLSPEQQARLFERFYRVPGIEQQSGSGVGLGLGLYICRTIVERHGGAVGVECAPGDGATFWFTLPLAAGGDPGVEGERQGEKRL